MDFDANIAKIVLLAAASVPFLVRVVIGSVMPKISLIWALSVVAYALIVLHYRIFGTSISEDTTEILLAGLAILNLTFWLGNAIRQPETFAQIEKWLSWIAVVFVLWNLQPGSSLNPENYIEDNYVGITANANMLGAYLVICCWPLLLNAAMRSSGRLTKLFFWAMLAAACLLVILTRSRASLLALGAGTGFLVLKAEHISRKVKIAMGGIIVLVTVYLIVQSSAKYLDIGLFGTRDMLVEQRLAAIAERPWFGWGFNSDVFAYYYAKSIFPPMEKGNTILQAMEELGVPFGSLVMIGFFAMVWQVANGLRTRFGDIGFSVTLVISATHLMFETWLFNFQSLLAIFIWLTVLPASFTLMRNESVQPIHRLATA